MTTVAAGGWELSLSLRPSFTRIVERPTPVFIHQTGIIAVDRASKPAKRHARISVDFHITKAKVEEKKSWSCAIAEALRRQRCRARTPVNPMIEFYGLLYKNRLLVVASVVLLTSSGCAGEKITIHTRSTKSTGHDNRFEPCQESAQVHLGTFIYLIYISIYKRPLV